ncbi:radical SAM protein [Acutalibacter muris]|uniref:Radical SAM protein n=1 Tax=Acutalibacter muris TaxID=1796620 RepID=A0A1Z2XQ34_9FIRM|nr:radical SAM protein [Acutalibacter muris]ANU52765.1 radical SAM protein [Hungateiclostridiaceae bacterium KB18]ASB40568.1 radical SAM protein [Acutalibacter muris]QQR29848.1 radical SAM protein [Acutalibacter muris]
MKFTGTIWRPPYEASSMLLEVTAGCTHHKCKFCTLYNDLPFKFRMSPMEDIECDLQEVADTLKQWHGFRFDRAFLTGANPFVLKTERLLAITELIRKYVPTVQTIGCFARIADVTLKSDSDLNALAQAGFDGLTIGIETGDDEALRFMTKGYAAVDIVEQCTRLDKAGIHYNFFYLVGISGMGRGEISAKATAAVCNQLHPQLIGANMLTIYPDSELYQEIQRGNWQEESEVEKYHEIRTLIESLDITTEFAALGASNAFQLHGTLPQDKAALVAAIDQIIDRVGEEKLRDYRKNLRHL